MQTEGILCSLLRPTSLIEKKKMMLTFQTTHLVTIYYNMSSRLIAFKYGNPRAQRNNLRHEKVKQSQK